MLKKLLIWVIVFAIISSFVLPMFGITLVVVNWRQIAEGLGKFIRIVLDAIQ